MNLLNPAPPLAAAPVRAHPAWVDDELANLRTMKTGDGVNQSLFRIAKGLAPYRNASEIEATLRAAVRNCGRRVPDREILRAIQNSRPYAYQPAVGGIVGATVARPAVSRWPETNAEQREAVLRDVGTGFELADLWGNSPVCLESGSTELVIDALFPGNPLLCVGKTNSVFATKAREEWRGQLGNQQFIVPSPMSRVKGTTKEGTVSEHCLDNTGSRRFAVVEFDRGSIDEQAAIIWHLRGRGVPLVLAVHSGGKSVHGWFYCAGVPEEQVENFYRYCVTLGADRATYTKSQFVRMPDGVRMKDGMTAPQHVCYFDPAALPKEVQS